MTRGAEPSDRPLALHHLALGANDVERLAAFYACAFGLVELRRNHDADGNLRSIWLTLGDATLMIEHTSRSRQVVTGVDAGLFLIAFRVVGTERDAVERRLAELGHPLESRTEHSSYFRDPEGNRFALSSYPLDA